MNFDYSDKTKELRNRVEAFMDKHIYPAERIFSEQHEAQQCRWDIPPVLDELKAKAKAAIRDEK